MLVISKDLFQPENVAHERNQNGSLFKQTLFDHLQTGFAQPCKHQHMFDDVWRLKISEQIPRTKGFMVRNMGVSVCVFIGCLVG